MEETTQFDSSIPKVDIEKKTEDEQRCFLFYFFLFLFIFYISVHKELFGGKKKKKESNVYKENNVSYDIFLTIY